MDRVITQIFKTFYQKIHSGWCFIIFVILIYAFNVFSNAYAVDFWESHSQGWHWYQNPKWIVPKKAAAKTKRDHVQGLTPTEQMSIVQKIAKDALNQAILNPTPENVRYYIEVQNKVSEQGSKFAKTWQRVLLNKPNMDYSITHPYNHLGKDIYLDQQKRNIAQYIHNLSRKYGLFFFFKSSCPYCHRLAPIIKDFSVRYGIAVVPITLDGRTLPEFPNARHDNGAAFKFRVSVVPALFAVNPVARKVIPIAYGFVTENEIASRIYSLKDIIADNDEQPMANKMANRMESENE